MKPLHVLWLVIGSVAITAGALTFGYLISQEPEEENTATVTATTQPSSNGGSLSVTQGGTGQLLGESVDPNNPGATAPEGNRGQATIDPAEFGIYEQYSGENNSLFAEIVTGTGAVAEPGDTVIVRYNGWLTDGTQFDGSPIDENGQVQAFSFQLGAGQVIRGWDESVAGMQVGGQRLIVVPPAAGYGAQGQNQIPPNAVLVFEVEVLDVEKAAQPPADVQQPIINDGSESGL